MKTKGGKEFSISGSEWKNGTLIVDYWIGGCLRFHRFLFYSKKDAYKLLRQKARAGELD